MRMTAWMRFIGSLECVICARTQTGHADNFNSLHERTSQKIISLSVTVRNSDYNNSDLWTFNLIILAHLYIGTEG